MVYFYDGAVYSYSAASVEGDGSGDGAVADYGFAGGVEASDD